MVDDSGVVDTQNATTSNSKIIASALRERSKRHSTVRRNPRLGQRRGMGVADRRDDALAVDEPDSRSSLSVLLSNLVLDVPRRRSIFARSCLLQ